MKFWNCRRKNECNPTYRTPTLIFMVKSILQKTATTYVATNFKTSKMGKTWYFIKKFRAKTKVRHSCNSKIAKIKLKKIKGKWKHGPHKHTKRDHGDKTRTWVWNNLLEMVWKKRGMQGHPQACGFANSCPLFLPHHIMSLISIKEIFFSPWYSNAYKMVSSPNKWYNNFYQDANSSNYLGDHFIQN